MSGKTKLVLMIIVAVAAVGLIGGYAYTGYRSDYCTDEVPDVTSVYVYTVDKGIGDLNRTYMRGKGYSIPKGDAPYVTYQDIPTVAVTENVEAVYIFDDARFEALSDSFSSGGLTEINVAVPRDVIRYYGAPSGMSYMFDLDPAQMPETDPEYALIRCTADSCEWSSDPVDEKTCMLYYKYDTDTWGDFNDRLIRYILENDATSDVSMLVTISEKTPEKAARIQDLLMQNFPGSNYLSAEFARVFRDKNNSDLGNRIATFAGVVIVVAAGIEILIAVSGKRAKKPRK